MAEMLRRTHDLTALNCRLDVRNRQAVVLSQVFRGSEALGSPVETPLKALGLAGAFTPGDLNVEEVGLRGTALEEQLLSTALDLEPSLPLWLQIGRDAQRLAALPWEATLAQGASRALLRIPNFLVNPFDPGARVRIAICATDPSVPGSVELAVAIRNLLQVLSRSARGPGKRKGRTYEVNIFTDADACFLLGGPSVDLSRDYPALNIVLRDPQEFSPSRERGHTGIVRNAWLQWLKSAYLGTGVDVVHFICPGYFLEESGALVLARSPLEQDDTQAPDFVGVKELARFYDRIGCNVMAFTRVGAPLWHVGLRILAYELSWQRAGPIILDAGLNAPALANAYSALLRVRDFDAHVNGELQFCVHPDAVAGLESFEDSSGPLGGFNSVVLNIERAGSGTNESVSMSAQASPDPDLYSRGWQADDDLIDPQREFTQQILRNERANLSSIKARSDDDSARETGAMRALDFLADLTQKDNGM